MAEYIQIKDLTEAEGVSDNDVLLLDDGTGIEKKATVKKVKDNILKLSQEEGNGLEMKADGLYAGGSGEGSALVPPITQDAYNDLTEEEKLNGQIREITDAQGFPVPFAILNDELETASNVLSAQKVKSEINTAFSKTAENNIYSDEEIIIGYLILNGVKKPIYRKCIYVPTLQNQAWIDSGIVGNVNFILNWYGCHSGSNGDYINHVYPINRGDSDFAIDKRNNKIKLAMSTTVNVIDIYLFLEYTKTTD